MSWLSRVKEKLSRGPASGTSGDNAGGALGREAGAKREENLTDLLNQGWALNQAGDLDGALQIFTRAIERGPDASAFYGRGLVRCRLRRYPEAIADLDLAIKLRPCFPMALTERGLAYAESGQVERALSDYDAALAFDPSYRTAHDNKGIACLLLGRWKEALPHLDIAIRLDPSQPMTQYHRGLAHEMLGDPSRAARDYQNAIEVAPKGEFASLAAGRRRDLQRGEFERSEPENPSTEDLWTEIVPLSLGDAVRDLLEKVRWSNGAFFGVVTLPDGGRNLLPIYGQDGIRKSLTEVADGIGPRILEMRLEQFDSLFCDPAWTIPRGIEPDRRALARVGRNLRVLMQGEQILGVAMDGFDHHDPGLPTTLFGERPVFGRSELTGSARRCASCQRESAYFDAVIEGVLLAGYACPQCTTSPTEAWVEARMRPGRWSRSGFLGESESLRDVMDRDAETLQRMGLTHSQISDALDRLLSEALLASGDRIARATEQFVEALRASGERGMASLAILPLGFSLDDLERRLSSGDRIPEERGALVGDHEVYLQIYLGYQYCPFTCLRLPWSDEVPAIEVFRKLKQGVAVLTPSTDQELPCSADLSYRFSNLEFLIVQRKTRNFLRGSGLLVHLIRDHHLFEGAGSPFRMDPERAAQVLGLWPHS